MDRKKNDPIDERLIDEGGTSRQDVVDAASEAFVQDQESPDHPSRVERSLGAEDPSHSVGSTRRGPGERDIGQS